MTSPLPKQGELNIADFPQCRICEGDSRYRPEYCACCCKTGLDLPTILAALRLSDRVAKVPRWDRQHAAMVPSPDGEYIDLSDLTESDK